MFLIVVRQKVNTLESYVVVQELDAVFVICNCPFLMILFLPKLTINVTILIWSCQFSIFG